MADLSTGAGTLVGAVVLVHARRYPLWEEGDLYKLLHQATQGSEHAVADAEAARRRLEQEWVEMGEGPGGASR